MAETSENTENTPGSKVLFLDVISACPTQNSIDAQNEDFVEMMKKKLPNQVVLYLTACGFDSPNAILSFDTSGKETDSFKMIVDTLQTQSKILKETLPDAKSMYGIFYNSPKSFCILPGHKNQILNFVKEIKSLLTRKSVLTVNPVNKPIKRPLPDESSDQPNDTSSASPAVQTSHADDPDQQVFLPQVPEVLQILKDTVTEYLKKSPEFINMNIEEGKHYSIQLYPVAGITQTEGQQVGASIVCHACGTSVKLPVARCRFRPTNFYRHIKSCLLQQNRKRKRMMRPITEPYCDIILKEISIGSSGNEVILPTTDHEDSTTHDEGDDDSAEQDGQGDHTYGTPINMTTTAEIENAVAEIDEHVAE